MYKILLVILTFVFVIAKQEESNEKYIDLLPEEEKQEFLNRIARRILEGIKSSDTPNESHADITDDQLDAQNAYVKKILKEESNNLRSQKKEVEVENKGDLDGLEQLDSSDGNKDEYVDLTLREGKRQKRKNGEHEINKESTTGLSYNVIPVQTVYDDNENMGDIKTDIESVTVTSLKRSTNFVIENELNKTNGVQNNITNQLSDLNANNLSNETRNHDVQSLRKSHNHKRESTLLTDFEPESFESSPTTDDYNKSNEEVTSTIDIHEMSSVSSNKTTWGSTQKIYGESNSDENDGIYKGETTERYQNVSKSEDITSSIVSKTSTDGTTTVLMIQNDKVVDLSKQASPIFLRSGHSIYKYTKTDGSLNESTMLLDLSSTTSSSVSDNHFEPITTETISITESNSDNIGNISNSEIPKVKGILFGKNDIFQAKLDENKTILRSRLDNLYDTKTDDSEILQDVSSEIKEVTGYEVYEVDANKPHFESTSKIGSNEHPYYIPVYNYAPENAYFMPDNKFGSDNNIYNLESKVTTGHRNYNFPYNIPNERSRFSGYSKNRNSGRNTKYVNEKQNKHYLSYLKPDAHNFLTPYIQYNPYDYPDTDYNYDRILRRGKSYVDADDEDNVNVKPFPDSNEPDHPLSSIHNSDTVKDHIRAIQRLLYLQKMFGYVPRKNDNTLRKANKLDKSSKEMKDDIAMDYYFGRSDSYELGTDDWYKNHIFTQNKSTSQHGNINIVPLTPVPLNNKSILKKNLSAKQLSMERKIEREKLLSAKFNGISFNKLFESLLTVLKDNIQLDNEDLIKYDWLKTTVNIQAAVKKLTDLTEKLQYGGVVHSKDIELIKYVIYIFETSKIYMKRASVNEKINRPIDIERRRQRNIEMKERKDIYRNIEKEKGIVPKPKIRTTIKQPIKLWKEYAAYIRSTEDESKGHKLQLLNDFQDLLQSFLSYLNEFHDVIKHIAIITKYNNQSWFQDIKSIYLKEASKKNLARVLLHLSLSRLFELLEESAASGLEGGFREYVKNNGEFVKRSKEESTLVLNILAELQKMDASE